MTLRRPFTAFFLTLAAFGLVARGQDKPPPAEDVQALQKKYQEERAAALEKKFPATALERADEQARRAEEALKDGQHRRRGAAHQGGPLARPIRSDRPAAPRRPRPRHRPDAARRHRERRHAFRRMAAVSPQHRATRRSRSGTSAMAAKSAPTAGRRTPRPCDRSRGRATASGSRQLLATRFTSGTRNPASSRPRSRATKSRSRRVAFHPDGNVLASGRDDISVRLWDVEKGTETANLNADFDKRAKSQIYSVTFSPNGKLVAAVNGNGQLQIWNPSLEEGQATRERASTPTRVRPPTRSSSARIRRSSSRRAATTRPSSGSASGPMARTCPGHGRPTTDRRAHEQRHRSGRQSRRQVPGDGQHRQDDSPVGHDARHRPVGPCLPGTFGRSLRVSRSPRTGRRSPRAATTRASGSGECRCPTSTRITTSTRAYVWTAAFSPDGKLFADAGADKIIYIRDIGRQGAAQAGRAHGPGHGSRVQRR